MVEEIRAAVVGCGGAGSNHAEGYARAEGAELVAVCDLDEDRARDLAGEHDVPWYTDQRAMQDAESPDAVSVATPETRHVEPTITALESGADAFCEKIMAHSPADGRRMIEAAERTGRALGVDYNYRHIPVFERIADAVGDEIGDPALVTMDVHAFCWHHAIDLLRWLLGEPTAVQSALIRDDEWDFWECHDALLYVPAPTAVATFEFPGDVVASLSASRHGGGPREHMIDLAIRGTEARIGVEGVRVTDTSGDPVGETLADELDACEPITLDESFHRSVQAFVSARRAGDRPPTSGEDGLAVMEIERAVVEAARAGGRIER